uniref:DNAJC23 n=2 Tax=Stichopus japonicus TaxID=307972 RepID=A0A6M2VHU2_STIJA|nr:DNAJC23 [Apostichopus japonicus]
MAKFEYDESGGTSLYFLVSFYVLFLIPFTYYLWPSKEKKEDPEKLRKQCHCDACEDKRESLTEPAAGATFKNALRWFILVVAWIIFIAIAIKASQVERDHIEYDPFEILQIDRGASDREIKRQYRILSLKYHPDKEGGDPDMFMRIAKAHAALTDEESRKNWEEHGNPDGPQATQFGIALPAWIVDQNNSVWVLAAYILAFIVILPIGVGTWWYRSIRYNAEEILMDTTQLFLHYIYKTPGMNLKRVMMILSGAFEFRKSHNSQVVQRPSDNEELPPLLKEFSSDIGLKNKEQPFCQPYSVKARILLYAHLARNDLPPKTLDQDRLLIVQKCPVLVQEMVNSANQITAWAKYQRGPGINKIPQLTTVENIMKLSPMIVQATKEKTSLMQLPHFTEDTLRICQSKKRNVKNIQQFARLKDSDRRHIFRNLYDPQYQDVLNVCAAMPVIDSSITFKVIDDEDTNTITAGSLVTATVTLKRSPLEINYDEGNTLPNGISGKETVKETVVQEEEVKQSESPVASKKKQPDWATGKKKKKAVLAKQQKSKKGGKKNKAAGNENKEKEEEKEKEDEKDEGNRVEEVSKNSESEAESDIEDDRKDEASDGNSDADVESDDEQWEELQAGIPRKEKVLEGRSKESHEVHCPYHPDVKQEWWWVYIADRKYLKFITAPTMVYDLTDEKEIQLQFPAPPKGTYQYTLCVRSDSYLDCDHLKLFKLDVGEAKKVVESHPQWEDSEEEEREEDDSAVSDSSDGGITESDDDDDDE